MVSPVNNIELQRSKMMDYWIGWGRVGGGIGLVLCTVVLTKLTDRQFPPQLMLFFLLALCINTTWLWCFYYRGCADKPILRYIYATLDALHVLAASWILEYPAELWLPTWSLFIYLYYVRFGGFPALIMLAFALVGVLSKHQWNLDEAGLMALSVKINWFVCSLVLATLTSKIIHYDMYLRGTLGSLAVRDGLTGLYNHRHFHEMLEQSLTEASRSGNQVGLLLIDVDEFKRFNDSWGHLTGDKVLHNLGKLINGCVGDRGQAFRYGGEEFAVVMADVGALATAMMAEQIQRKVASCSFAHDQVTVSIGWSMYPTHATSKDRLLEVADLALYAAKHDGRNRVRVAVEA